MPFTFASGVRAGVIAAALLILPGLSAAQEQGLVGATRDQVLARNGEPRSVMAAGDREILFFARERVVLRDGVVIEVEPLAAEPAPRRTPTPGNSSAPAAQSPADGANAGSGSATQPAGVTATSPASQAGASASTAPTPAASADSQPASPAPAREPEIAIKSVRPPAGTYTRPAPTKTTAGSPTSVDSAATSAAASGSGASRPPEPTPTQSTTPAAQPLVQLQERTPAPTNETAPTAAAGGVAPVAGVASAPETTTSAAAPAANDVAPTPPEQPVTAQSATEQTAAASTSGSSQAKPAPAPEAATRGGNTYLIVLGALGAGIGFLIWRRRQRQLELAATAVSRDALSPDVPAAAVSARFAPEHLARLDWKHFEELVAAYYGKTGVVAERTKAGPASPVHIKISWKGESRPFALVQCIAHPPGPIGVGRLQELFTVLTAEQIRRGYVVTSGKFNSEARDFAEEKHLTLLTGEAFLEKLNALPDSARAEVLHHVMAGDTSTPSCPKCEARMVRTPEDPSMLRCPTHGDVTLPSR